MSLSRELRRAIERGDFTAVEDDWLERLDRDPTRLDHFVAVARSLSGAGAADRASELLELVDDQLERDGEWQLRLELMEATRELHPAGASPHAEIVRTLAHIYDGQPSLEGLMELVGLHRAVDDVPRTWEKVRRLRQLMRFEVGTVVEMEGKGVGRIVELNRELASFKIELEAFGEIRVGFKAAGKLLVALDEEHFLHRKLTASEELGALPPARLLEELLRSYDRALTAAEIRQAVNGLLDDRSWSSWWTAARKHRQLVAEGSGTKQTYRWAESDAEADAAALAQFTGAKKLDTKLKIFRKEAARDPELGRAMAARLSAMGAPRASSAPEEAFAIASAIEREGLGEPESSWSTEALILGGADPTNWISRIGDRALRLSAFELARQRDDWAAVFGKLLERESEPRLLDHLADELRAGDAETLEALLDLIVGQPRRNPAAFVWAIERIPGDDLLGARDATRLIQAITTAVDRPGFEPFRARLRALLANDECLAALIARVTEDQAPTAEEALRRAHLEEYQRERLIEALHMRFPSLRPEQEVGLYATDASIAARRTELKRLLEKEIPANRKAIQEAREHGDLRENFEYKSARQRHEYLTARVAELDGQLRRVRPIDFSTVDGSEVRLGARVELEAEDGDRRRITILGPWESRPEEDVVSYESELAQRLLGKTPGDVVELFDREHKIERVEPAQG